MAYFDNFGIVSYRFGDNESPVLFNNLTAYVDVIDQVKENVAFYNKYTISAGERPDTLSYKLYGTPDYYWTFYMMNNHIRESGWPVDSYDMLSIAKSKYPYRVVTTNTNLTVIFPVGQSVTGVPAPRQEQSFVELLTWVNSLSIQVKNQTQQTLVRRS